MEASGACCRYALSGHPHGFDGDMAIGGEILARQCQYVPSPLPDEGWLSDQCLHSKARGD